MRGLIILSLVFSCFLELCDAQPGSLDPSFGNNGIVKTDFGYLYDYDYSTVGRQVLLQPDGSMYILVEAEGLTFIGKRLSNGSPDISYGNNGFSQPIRIVEAFAAEQQDGKIVVVGNDLTGGFALGRFNTNGILDNTFSCNGKHQDIPNSESNVINSIAIQVNGKIIIGGCAFRATNWDYAIARFNTEGSLDNTFNGDGWQIVDFSGTDDCISSIAIQQDGKIIAAGQTYTVTNLDFSVLRFNINGSLDNSFSNDGKQTTDFGFSEDVAKSVAIQDDGKIIVAGYIYSCNSVTCSNANYAVARYNVNGSPDNSFSGDGKQTADFGSYDVAASLAIQADGKIVVAGSSNPGSNSDLSVERFNKNGTLDATFSDDGKQVTDFTGDDYGNSVAIQSDGKIVVAGWDNSSNLDISRYNSNGSLDNSFSRNGLVTDRLNLKQGSTFYTSAATQPDGKLVAAGYTWNGNNYDFALARYNTDGSLDNSFSGDGRQTTDFNSEDDYAYSLVIQKDGKIILAGVTGADFALARYNIDGTPDNSFSMDGRQTTDLGLTVYDIANSMAVQSDGKILVAGGSGIDIDIPTGEAISDFALVRYNTDGTLDNTFSGDGIVTTNLGYDDIAKSIAIQADGKIVLAGSSMAINRGGGASYFAVARYNSDGTLDNTFSNDGKQFTSFAEFNYANSIAIQSDGKIIVSGNTSYEQAPTSSDFAVARYNVDGSLDNSFSEDGKVTTYFGTLYRSANPVTIQSNGNIIVGGGTNGDFTLVCYNTDGTLNTNFGANGIRITDASANDDRIESLVIDVDKLYAVGYGQFPGNLGVVARYIIPIGGPLPFNILDFTAVEKNRSVVIEWQIATEQNIAPFIIERSSNGIDFSLLQTLSSKGNNSLLRNYSIIDKHPLQDINFYKLKVVNADGKLIYSKVVAVKLSDKIEMKIFPSPASEILYVRASGKNEIGRIQIIDVTGKKIKDAKISLNGTTSFSINIHDLPKGIYSLLLHTKEKIESAKFVKE